MNANRSVQAWPPPSEPHDATMLAATTHPRPARQWRQASRRGGSRVLVVCRLALERDHGQPRRDHRESPGEDGIAEEEESEEEQDRTELGKAKYRTRFQRDRWRDHQVAL